MSEILGPVSYGCLWGHLIVNFISSSYNVMLSFEIQDEQKKKNLLSSALWIHSIISSVALLIMLLTYQFVVLEDTYWTLSTILMVIHILFNIIIMVINATNPDLSEPVLWTYQVISSIVMIIIVSFFTDTEILELIWGKTKKTKDKELANAKKALEVAAAEKPAAKTETENPVTKTETKKTNKKKIIDDAAGPKKTDAAGPKKTDTTGDFGKRQRRRNKKY